jgi:hypothetical protein
MAAQEEWIRRDIWHAEMFAHLLGRLRDLQEGDGTMLDNTVVLWVTDVAVGNTHDLTNMPFVLAGGGGGTLRTGRYVRFNGTPHNDLLFTLLQVMDVNDPSFGREDMTPSVLSTLLA